MVSVTITRSWMHAASSFVTLWDTVGDNPTTVTVTVTVPLRGESVDTILTTTFVTVPRIVIPFTNVTV